MGHDATAPAVAHDVGQTSGSGRADRARVAVRLFRDSVGRRAKVGIHDPELGAGGRDR